MQYSYGPNYIMNLIARNEVNIGFDLMRNRKGYRAVFGPDSYELLMWRLIASESHSTRIRVEAGVAFINYYVRRELNLRKVKRLLVFGEEDAKFINEIRIKRTGGSPIAKFVIHPVSDIFLRKPIVPSFKRRNDVLIAGKRGRYNELYCGNLPEKFEALVRASPELRRLKYLVVGQDYKSLYEGLRGVVDIDFLPYVNDYCSVLDDSKVYLAFDAIGVGTKNRTLQSIARGMKVVGTAFSFENIKVPEFLKFEYKSVNDIEPTLLASLSSDGYVDLTDFVDVHNEQSFIETIRNE